MSSPLSLYLNDHLAGARFALELLGRLQEKCSNHPLKDDVRKLIIDIQQDCDVLQQLADDLGTGGSVIKETASWFVEKAGRLKLRLDGENEVGAFEALEMLSLGVLGKLKLWRALSQIKNSNARLQKLDFNALIARAQSQHDTLEAWRLQLAETTLADDAPRLPQS